MSKNENEMANVLAAGSIGIGALIIAGSFYLLWKAADLLGREVAAHPLNVPLWGSLIVGCICGYLAWVDAGSYRVLYVVAALISLFVAVAIAKFIETADETCFLPEVSRESFAQQVAEPWWDAEQDAA